MKHFTKNKGDLGVLKAKADLCGKGYLVLSPESEHSPFDLVVYKDKKFLRIQVKYREIKKGSITVGFRTSHSDKNGCHTKPIDKAEIDLYCIYCKDNDTCYYLNVKDFNKAATLRVNKPGNNQKKFLHFSENYLDIKI